MSDCIKCGKIQIFFLAFNLSNVFIMLINVKMSTIVDILTFMSMINFMFSLDEHEMFYKLSA